MLKILTLAIALLIVPAFSASGQDFDKGLAAAQRGDFATALREWTPLAEQGFANAQFNLGLMNANGQGAPQDYKAAVRWYTLAAEQGNSLAYKKLGLMYEMGTGVIQDNVYAHMWWNIAASSGDKDAVKYRDFLAGILTPSQIAEAQDLARECVAKNYKGC